MPLAPPGWTLRVRGAVDHPRDLSLDDLRRMTRTDLRVRHHCVEGWSAVASWHGVRVADVARAVGARADARYVEFRSFDGGYYSCWDRESAEHPQSILAYGMNGDTLSPAHGAPVRLYGAVKLGYKSVKYLDEIRFLPRASGGFWEDRGYEWYAGV
jgi:DMSO/TMAO reductase YedYZ molybdopterin-dependent catalytic subunit